MSCNCHHPRRGSVKIPLIVLSVFLASLMLLAIFSVKQEQDTKQEIEHVE